MKPAQIASPPTRRTGRSMQRPGGRRRLRQDFGPAPEGGHTHGGDENREQDRGKRREPEFSHGWLRVDAGKPSSMPTATDISTGPQPPEKP